MNGIARLNYLAVRGFAVTISHYHRLLILSLSLIVALAGPAPAGDGAQLSGRVCSPDGGGVQGVAISLSEATSGRTVRVMTGLKGTYRAASLAPGTYELKAEAAGFKPAVVGDIRLGADEGRIVDVTLSFSAIQEMITVIGAAPRGALQAAEARESAARDMGEALTRINGIWKVRKGGIANDVVLRGFPSQDINVLIDGQRIYGACPNHMDPAAFHVDFAEIDRVETAPGPFDIRNQGSLGGLLNVITRNSAQGIHGTLATATGAYGFFNPSATVSFSEGRFSALGGFSYRASKPFTDPSKKAFTEYANYRPGIDESDAFRARTGWGKFSFSPRTNHLFQVAYTRQEADHVLYPYLMMDAIYDDTDRVNVGYQIAPRSGSWKSIRLQTYFTQVRHWMTDAFRVSSANLPRDYSMGTFAATSALGAKLEAETGRVSFGLEAYSRGWRATTEMAGMQYKTQSSIPDVETTSLGGYADYRLRPSDRLKVSAGLRLDYIRTAADVSQANTDLYYAYNATRSTERKDVFPSGHVLLVYALSSGLEFRMGAGHTVRAPDARERYFALKRAGSDWVGNPDLDPSRNTGLDGALSYRLGSLLLSANAYYNDVRNFIAVRNRVKVNPVAGVMNKKARSYANIDARIYGTELQASVTISRALSFTSGFSYVRGTQPTDPANGVLAKNLAEIPPFSSRSVLRFDNGLVWGELEGIIAGAQNKVDASLLEQPTPGYELANVRFGVNVKSFRVWVALNNVFDRRFVEHLSFQRDPFRSGVRVYEPGRNFFLNIDFRI
jgi:iron complex outermembrane receptor protein